MASGQPGRPLALQTSDIAVAPEGSSIDSPARGRETRTALLQKLRPPQFVHTWVFWHEPPAATGEQPEPKPWLDITDVKGFWSLFNNFDFSKLPQKHSVHLFHRTVKPLWEDPRNVKGGGWTFRVPKAAASDFWREICLLAVGEQLQEAVQTQRTTFRDDICGISFRPRFASTLVTIWNRDGAHEEGIQKISDTIQTQMPPHLTPKEGSYYYKKHSDHDDFAAATSAAPTPSTATGTAVAGGVANPGPQGPRHARGSSASYLQEQRAGLLAAQTAHESVNDSLFEMQKEVDKVKKMLEDVQVNDQHMDDKVAAAAKIEQQEKDEQNAAAQ